jgi:ligand-binding sensor domain-containing protein
MKFSILIMLLFIISVISSAWCQADPPIKIPYIYTEWESFTTESTHGALVNDHIFFLKADRDSLWVGTENGLMLYHEGNWQSWTEKEGLPWRVVIGIAKDKKTGDLWLALFGEGIARFSGGQFEHFTQMNSGLLNDVVYNLDIEGDDVWIATTAGISRYNQVTGEWATYNERHAPMEEVWVYNVDATPEKVFFAVWGSGILEWDIKDQDWTEYLDPDGEMEIDLYRDDGLIHVITTAASYVDNILWASTYFGLSRYDGRNWRGYHDHDSGLPSAFINFVLGRSGTSSYSCTDKGLGVLADFETDTWVTYHRKAEDARCWTADIMVGKELIKSVETNLTLPNHFMIAVEFIGNDVWIGTGHGLARGIGKDYYPGLR